MSDPHASPAVPNVAHDHHGHDGHISDSTFVKIFGILLVCTAISFAANQVFGHNSPVVNFIIIGAVACFKATLVMYFFMHLKIDWRKVFVFLIPICILAPMVIMVLWPDMVLAWRLYTPDGAP